MQLTARHTTRPGLASLQILGLCLLLLAVPLQRWSQLAGGVHLPVQRQASAAWAAAALGKLPLSFEENRGQSDPATGFLAHLAGGTISLRRGASAVMVLKPATEIGLRLVGANGSAAPVGEHLQAGTANYFIGSQASRWLTGIPTYGAVRYSAVYPGVDLVYHGSGSGLEYDLLLDRGVGAGGILFAVDGAQGLRLDASGNLVIDTSAGQVTQAVPHAYQEIGGQRRTIGARYLLEGGNRFGFALAGQDVRWPVVIDPSVGYSSYLGGSSFDTGAGIAVDAAGEAYVTGSTYGNTFPNVGGAASGGLGDAFVTKFKADGTGLVYSTYLGGSANDGGAAIAIDATGSAYVTGSTRSTNFPTTPGAFQPSLGGVYTNAFVTKLTLTGGLAYSSYLGGSGGDEGDGIAVDATGSAYVTGQTGAGDFPTTSLAFQRTNPGPGPHVFVTKVAPTGTALVYSTYLAGDAVEYGKAIAVDSAGSAYVTGETQSTTFPTTSGAFETSNPNSAFVGFVTKLNILGSGLVYSTYLGGLSGPYSSADGGYGIAVDGSGDAYVAGSTFLSNFPTTPGAFQTVRPGASGSAFVSKLNPAGSGLLYSTFLGGSRNNYALGVSLDGAGEAYVTGSTESPDFPTTNGAFQANLITGGGTDAFMTKFKADGTGLIYSTFLGGSGSDFGSSVAVDGSGNAYLTGRTNSTDFPTTAGAFQTNFGGYYDAFVTKLTMGLTVADLLTQIKQTLLTQGAGPGHSLAAKLDAIMDSISRGNTRAACGQLDAFINEVQAQSGKTLSGTEASTLVALAQQLEVLQKC